MAIRIIAIDIWPRSIPRPTPFRHRRSILMTGGHYARARMPWLWDPLP